MSQTHETGSENNNENKTRRSTRLHGCGNEFHDAIGAEFLEREHGIERHLRAQCTDLFDHCRARIDDCCANVDTEHVQMNPAFANDSLKKTITKPECG